MIELLEVPAPTTIQDLGRYGFQKFGVPVSGVMDDFSARIANYLVGNEDNAPLLEFVLRGPTLKFHTSTIFAVAGDCNIKLNGERIDSWKSYRAEKDDILEVGELNSGVYGYIAFAGGVACTPILGSCSTYLRGGFGRALRRGDMLKLNAPSIPKEGLYLPPELIPRYSGHKEIRVILGPQKENFTRRGIETFLNSYYTLTPHWDRMGYRLDGPPIEHSKKGADIITDAIPAGSIQVPSSGKPIVMLADRQTTGGYAKIAVIARVDLAKMAQTRVGERIKFKAIEVEEAQALLRRREGNLRGIKEYLVGRARAYRIRVSGEEFLVFVKMLDSE